MDSYNQNEVPDELQLEQWYSGKQIIAYIMGNPTISVISINNCLYDNELENYKVIAELQKDIAKLDNTQDNNTQDNNAKDNKLPRTGSVDYLPIGVIITIMGIALLAYRGRRQVKRY